MKGPLAIDANLLLLLIVGSAARHYIAQHKRLKDYTLEDFDLLVDIIGEFPSIILLPNTLTEVSNFGRHIAEPAKSQIARTLRALIDGASETFIPSRDAAERPEFTTLGLTDAALLAFSSIHTDGPAPTLLTADLDLAIAAEMKGYLVENFNHYRDASLT